MAIALVYVQNRHETVTVCCSPVAAVALIFGGSKVTTLKPLLNRLAQRGFASAPLLAHGAMVRESSFAPTRESAFAPTRESAFAIDLARIVFGRGALWRS